MGLDILECFCCGKSFPDFWSFSCFSIRGIGWYTACGECEGYVRDQLLPTERCYGEFLFEPLPARGGRGKGEEEDPIGPRVIFVTSADLRAYLREPAGDVPHRLGFHAGKFEKPERARWLAGGQLTTPVGSKLQWFEGPKALEEMQAFRADPDRGDFGDCYEMEWVFPGGIEARISLMEGNISTLQHKISVLKKMKVDQKHILEESDAESELEE